MNHRTYTLREIEAINFPDEEEIIANWQGKTETLTSIACTTFNHESYIATCIKSLLLQKTSFPFEIIIHDDCSTDETSSIVFKLAKKYPRLINLIQQTENQYSKGIRILPEIIAPACKGRYIAICEGDDAWNYDFKLDDQIKLLESKKNITLICHGSFIFDNKTSSTREVKHLSSTSRFLSRGELILAGGAHIPTASIVVKKEVFNDIPVWWKRAPVGDYPLVLRAQQLGKVFYDHQVWCTYRVNVAGSWSQRTPRTFAKYQHHAEKMSALLNSFSRTENFFIKKAAIIMSSKYIFDLILRTSGEKEDKVKAARKNKKYLTFTDHLLIQIFLKFNMRTEKIHTAIKFFVRMLFRYIN